MFSSRIRKGEMKVLILAAGYGTRLHSLVKDTPKALLEINGEPLIHYILDKIGSLSGLNEIIVVTNDKFYAVFKDWAQTQKAYRCPITVVNDGTKTPEERLGSIGDIDFVLKKKHLEEDLLVVGGDNLFDYSLQAYVDFARSKSPSVTIGLYDIGNVKEAGRFGVVGLDGQNRVTSFEEKPLQPKSSLIAMCCYYLPQKSLRCVADYLVESGTSDTAGDYIRWLHQKNDVYGFKFCGKWYDIGSVETYKEAQKKFKIK